jgi:hypothetical protein
MFTEQQPLPDQPSLPDNTENSRSPVRQDKNTEPRQGELPPELEQYLQDLEARPVRTVLREVANRTKDGVDHTVETVTPYLEHARKETGKVVTTVTDGVVQAGKSAADATTKLVQHSAEATRKGIARIPGEVAKIYERLGSDPDKEAGLLNELVKITPILGAAQEYADGWRAYHRGKELNKPELVEKGQILCIAAMINGKFDVLTLGVGSFFRHTPRLATLGLRALTAMRGLNAISKVNLDPISHLSTYLVRNHARVREIANATLESVSPEKIPTTDQAE